MNDYASPITQVDAPPPQYFLLVDFDNLFLNVCGRNNYNRMHQGMLYDLVRRLDLETSFFDAIVTRSRIRLRLYGGWYRESRLSVMAQNLRQAVMVGGLGPYDTRARVRVNVQSELAHNLYCMGNSQTPLYATFRSVRSQTCPLCHSNRSVYDNHQKMVDTMLCCDLLYLVQQANTYVAVVTSDDDLLPPLLQQASAGKHVYHMLTKSTPSESFTRYYRTLFPANYHCVPY